MKSQRKLRRQAIRFLHARPLARRAVLIILALAFLTGVTANKSDEPAHAASLRTLGNHYLMLVNTAIASKMDAQKMAQFDRSPYDGLAVSFADAYDTSPVVSVAAMEAQMSAWKKSTAKDIWPWVYLTRMIGVNDAEGNAPSMSSLLPAFSGIGI